MCNSIDKNSTMPVKKSGIAWKLFSDERRSFISHRSYNSDDYGWINWYYSDNNRGFCCFPNKGEAIKAVTDIVKKWHCSRNLIHIKKIKYMNCIGRHMEDNFVEDSSFDTLIVKSFKFFSNEKQFSFNY